MPDPPDTQTPSPPAPPAPTAQVHSPDADPTNSTPPPDTPPARSLRPKILNRTIRIRGKLIALHTSFSLLLAVVLLLTLRSPISRMVAASETREAELALALLASGAVDPETIDLKGVNYQIGSASALSITTADAARAREAAGRAVPIILDRDTSPGAIRWDPVAQLYQLAASRSPAARSAVNRLYILLTISLLAVYIAIALTLELVILPRQVYSPIDRLRRADDAVQRGDRAREVIPEPEIPADELGQLMRSRNASILKLRDQERQLNQALERIESIANELRRKNHMLEAARRNLADQDRLASLGIMSAGIAHELNTPLAVLKGTLEQLAEQPGRADTNRIQLMLRVARRLEALSESLLDFARIRPRRDEPINLANVIQEAWTLLSIDKDIPGVELNADIDPNLECVGDPDRLIQVFVNILRNAAQAADAPQTDQPPRITISTRNTHREGRDWLSIIIQDNGPGIDPAVLPTLFEPFASTRLDANGTGLGLAVSQGIIDEHAGVLLARNAPPPDRGAIFEIMLPIDTQNDNAPAEAGAQAKAESD